MELLGVGSKCVFLFTDCHWKLILKCHSVVLLLVKSIFYLVLSGGKISASGTTIVLAIISLPIIAAMLY